LATTTGEDNKFLSPLLLNLTAFKMRPTGGVRVDRSTHLTRPEQREGKEGREKKEERRGNS
jgi:hypothetical protein